MKRDNVHDGEALDPYIPATIEDLIEDLTAEGHTDAAMDLRRIEGEITDLRTERDEAVADAAIAITNQQNLQRERDEAVALLRRIMDMSTSGDVKATCQIGVDVVDYLARIDGGGK